MIFKQYLKQIKNSTLDEVLITFGKKAYPKFGNIIILAGGTGSGKGFVTSSLLGIEGKVLDVDALKILATKSELAAKKFPELKAIGDKIRGGGKMDAKTTSRLHDIVGELGYADKKLEALGRSILSSSPDRKPNIIFDVTLKDEKKLKKITDIATKLGYEKENIHIVWVLQKTSIAMTLNMARTRNVAEDMLLTTHQGALNTMTNILKSGVTTNINGDVYIVFNRPQIDATITAKTDNTGQTLKSKHTKSNVMFIEKALILQVKEKGKAFRPAKDIIKEFLTKIKNALTTKQFKSTIKWFKGLKKGKILENYMNYLSSSSNNLP